MKEQHETTKREQRLTPGAAWEKLKGYCAYQERCHWEVKEKLYSYGLNRQDAAQLLARLIEEDYLNEERFAVAYARGHATTKRWGKVKIRAGLKQRSISDYCIKKAIQGIDEDEYLTGLQKLATRKWETLQKQPLNQRRYQCRQYLLQKGYEASLIADVMAALT